MPYAQYAVPCIIVLEIYLAPVVKENGDVRGKIGYPMSPSSASPPPPLVVRAITHRTTRPTARDRSSGLSLFQYTCTSIVEKYQQVVKEELTKVDIKIDFERLFKI